MTTPSIEYVRISHRRGRPVSGSHDHEPSVGLWVVLGAQQRCSRSQGTRFSTMQDYLNLLYREEEREMLPLCAAEGSA